MNKLFTIIGVFSALSFSGISAETYKLCPILEETDEVMLHRRILLIEAELKKIEDSVGMIHVYLGNNPFIIEED